MALLRAREPYFIFKEPKLEENEKIFLLPDDVKMHVDKISSWGCLVMEYSDPGMDVLGEDGDRFWRMDYKTPDEMFQNMLKETEG